MSAGDLAIGLAIGAAHAQDVEDEAARKSHAGKDQILLKTKKKRDVIGESIAGIYTGWYYNKDEGQVYRRSAGLFSGVSAFFAFAGVAILLAVYWTVLMIWICSDYWHRDVCLQTWMPLDFAAGLFLSIGIGILAGFVFHPFDERVKSISMSEATDGRTKVLLTVYDSHGHRLLDEDDIDEIREMV